MKILALAQHFVHFLLGISVSPLLLFALLSGLVELRLEVRHLFLVQRVQILSDSRNARRCVRQLIPQEISRVSFRKTSLNPPLGILVSN